MPYVAVENFKSGLDRRRMEVTTPAGSLLTAKNVHLTRGGEVESRKQWVSKYQAPGTKHLAKAGGKLFVFGSGQRPASLSADINYQRLQSPNGQALASIHSTTISSGKLYVIAEFADGAILHFYDGVLVTDWISGIVSAAMGDLGGVAAHLASLVDVSDNYVGTSVGNVVTMTGQSHAAFTITAAAVNGGAVNDQTATVVTTQQAVGDVAEIVATGSFTITGGEISAGTNQIASVRVNGVTVTSGPVDYAGTSELTAAAVAANITASTAAYTAIANGAAVKIMGGGGSGSSPNGFSVQVNVTGNVQVSTGTFRISGGTNSTGVNVVASVKVNGIEILNVSVDWATSNSATATAVAAQIVSYASTPEYNAFAVGADIYICPVVVSQSAPANLVLAIVVGGNVAIENQTAVNTNVVRMSGGVTAAVGQPQISTVTLGGSFDVGDKFTINTKMADDEEVFGFDRVSGQTGTIALSHRTKVYVGAGEILDFSGVKAPTQFNGDVTGAGLIDVSGEAEGSEAITGLGVYQNSLVVFAREATQIWAMDPDPDANTILQVLPNIGTVAPNSVISYGESDVFFLADSGIRSLRARTGVNTAAVNDIGTPIDELVTKDFIIFGFDAAELAFGLLDPVDGRYWLFFGSNVYVFTYFPGEKVSAWSRYELTFTPVAGVTLNRQIYIRADDTIYLYGGDDGLQYDAEEQIVELPFLSANTIATFKQFEGLDLAIEGEWNVYVCLDPKTVQPTSPSYDPSRPYGAEDLLGVFYEPTFQDQAMKAVGESPMFKLRFVKAKAQYGRIGMVVAHYDVDDAS